MKRRIMESTLELKQSLLTTIGDIDDRNTIMSIINFVKRRLHTRTAHAKAKPVDDIVVAPEVWNIIKRIHPVDIDDEKEEYYEHLNRKYQ